MFLVKNSLCKIHVKMFLNIIKQNLNLLTLKKV